MNIASSSCYQPINRFSVAPKDILKEIQAAADPRLSWEGKSSKVVFNLILLHIDALIKEDEYVDGVLTDKLHEAMTVYIKSKTSNTDTIPSDIEINDCLNELCVCLRDTPAGEKVAQYKLNRLSAQFTFQPMNTEVSDRRVDYPIDIQYLVDLTKPEKISTGRSGSYFIFDEQGQKVGVFKPMSEEGNDRSTIKPGQGAGNEVLMYELDRNLGGAYKCPKTKLIPLESTAFKKQGKQLGSFQQFLPGVTMHQLNLYEMESISREELDRLNIKLISGGSDSHFGNFLYCRDKKEIGIIDAGYDFIGHEEHPLIYRNQSWKFLPKANEQMSPQEYVRLRDINVETVMNGMYDVVEKNKQVDPQLALSTEKMILLRMRLELAKLVGQSELTQLQWLRVLYDGSFIEIYKKQGNVPEAEVQWEDIRLKLAALVNRHKLDKSSVGLY